jgi:hypothetical protein
MRFFLVTLLACAGILFFGCNDEVDDIVLSANWVDVWVDTDTVVTIAGDVKAYTVTSSDENIVSVSVADNQITIRAISLGNTTIQVADGKRVTSIKVRTVEFFGMYRRYADHRKIDPVIDVVAADPAFAETLANQIRAGLDEELAKDYGILFSPTDGMFWEYHSRKIIREGPYAYSNLILTLGDDEVYEVIPKSLELAGLKRDYTHIYQQQHPDQDISRVIITKYLQLYLPPG